MKTEPAIIRPHHLGLALNLADRAICRYITLGQIPPPDAKGHGGLKLWKLSTIRAWNAETADAIEQLLKIPAFKPRPVRTSHTQLFQDAA